MHLGGDWFFRHVYVFRESVVCERSQAVADAKYIIC